MMTMMVLALLAQDASPATLPPEEKLRCIRQQETGSYLKKRKVCHTEREWRQLERGDDAELRRLRDRTPINSRRPTGG